MNDIISRGHAVLDTASSSAFCSCLLYVVLKWMSYTSLFYVLQSWFKFIWKQPSLILRQPGYEAKSKPADLTPSNPPPNLWPTRKRRGRCRRMSSLLEYCKATWEHHTLLTQGELVQKLTDTAWTFTECICFVYTRVQAIVCKFVDGLYCFTVRCMYKLELSCTLAFTKLAH